MRALGAAGVAIGAFFLRSEAAFFLLFYESKSVYVRKCIKYEATLSDTYYQATRGGTEEKKQVQVVLGNELIRSS